MARLKILVATSLATLFLASLTMAQETPRHEVSGQVTGFFIKDTDGNGISQDSTKTVGVLGGYRF